MSMANILYLIEFFYIKQKFHVWTNYLRNIKGLVPKLKSRSKTDEDIQFQNYVGIQS